MKRLIDEDSVAGSPNHLLADFVRATGRLEPDDFRKHRVLTKVRYAQRRPRPRFRAAVVVVLLVSGSATAATVARLAVRGQRSNLSTRASVSSSPPIAPVLTAAAQLGVGAPTLPPETSASPPVVEESRVAAKPPRIIPRPEAQTRIADAPTPGGAYDSEDAAQVVEAISALRNKGDGVRAGALLAGYLSAHPRGVLQEDALALSIEAAAARHDPSAAADYGKIYLKQFPSGRFRAVALRASKMVQH